MCDFSEGFKAPEMVKKRPVVIFTPSFAGREGLVTIVPLSTRKPDDIKPYHYQLPKECLPKTGFFQEKETWVKADMLYTVGFERLEMIKIGKDKESGKRLYFKERLDSDIFLEIQSCVLCGLGFDPKKSTE